jgi:hypothetical protein
LVLFGPTCGQDSPLLLLLLLLLRAPVFALLLAFFFLVGGGWGGVGDSLLYPSFCFGFLFRFFLFFLLYFGALQQRIFKGLRSVSPPTPHFFNPSVEEKKTV